MSNEEAEYSGFFTDFLYDNPTYDLSDALDFVLDAFPSDFVQFWGLERDHAPSHLDPDDWETYKELYEISERLAEAAAKLLRPGQLPEKYLEKIDLINDEAESEEALVQRVLAIAREMEQKGSIVNWSLLRRDLRPGTSDARARLGFFQTCMQLHAFRLYHVWPHEMALRMLTLLDYISRAKGVGIREYLVRVATCYVHGMRTEFAVMARAALEKALDDVIPEDEAKKRVGVPAHKRLGMDRWIDAATAIGALDDEAERAARVVKKAGDDAVHFLPGTEPDPDELLPNLYQVLTCLERYQRPDESEQA